MLRLHTNQSVTQHQVLKLTTYLQVVAKIVLLIVKSLFFFEMQHGFHKCDSGVKSKLLLLLIVFAATKAPRYCLQGVILGIQQHKSV